MVSPGGKLSSSITGIPLAVPQLTQSAMPHVGEYVVVTSPMTVGATEAPQGAPRWKIFRSGRLAQPVEPTATRAARTRAKDVLILKYLRGVFGTRQIYPALRVVQLKHVTFFQLPRPRLGENVLRLLGVICMRRPESHRRVPSPAGPSNVMSPPIQAPTAKSAHTVLYCLLAICVWLTSAAPGLASFADCLRPQDEFYVIDVRNLGSTFCEIDWQRIHCRYFARLDEGPARRWVDVPLEDFYAADNPDYLTLIFVHGNRVEPGEDAADTVAVYRALLACVPDAPPIRLVSFSWPAEQIRGPVRDFRLKAARSDPAAWHLAWVLSRLRVDIPAALVGYSYGARVIGGALHLLAGGSLCGHSLPVQADRAPMRVLQISAAVHHDWLLPGRPHGMAMDLIERLVLINNCCDPVMRLYHVSSRGGRPVALGRFGLTYVNWLGDDRRVCQIDACGQVGKRHALEYYLASRRLMGLAARQLWTYESAPAPPQ